MRLRSSCRSRRLQCWPQQLEQRLTLDGGLDPLFGSAGLVTTDFFGQTEPALAIAGRVHPSEDSGFFPDYPTDMDTEVVIKGASRSIRDCCRPEQAQRVSRLRGNDA